MVVLDTVGVVVVVGDKGGSLEYAGAGAAAETVCMEALSHCLQHAVGDSLPTSETHGQGILRMRKNNKKTGSEKCKKKYIK